MQIDHGRKEMPEVVVPFGGARRTDQIMGGNKNKKYTSSLFPDSALKKTKKTSRYGRARPVGAELPSALWSDRGFWSCQQPQRDVFRQRDLDS